MVRAETDIIIPAMMVVGTLLDDGEGVVVMTAVLLDGEG